MAWMSKAEASVALAVSIRTLERKIARGEVETRSDGRNVTVNLEVENHGDTVSHLGRQLAELATAGAVTSAKDAQTLRDVLAVTAEYRDELRSGADRCRRSARMAWATSSVLLIAVCGIAGTAGWVLYESGIEHVGEVGGLHAGHARVVADHRHAMGVIEGRLDVAEDRILTETAAVGDLRDRLAGVTASRNEIMNALDDARRQIATTPRLPMWAQALVQSSAVARPNPPDEVATSP